MTPNKQPTGRSATISKPSSIDSPEVMRRAAANLKAGVKDGSVRLHPENHILWTPEELAQMTPAERARCQPSHPQK